MSRFPKTMMYVLYSAVGVAAVTIAAGAVILLLHVDDWSRDLTTNIAATDSDAADERLRPLQSALSPEELAEHTEAAARGLVRWELVDRQTEGRSVQLHFVRTTTVMRYKDDIRVLIEPTAEGSLLTAESRSRVGRGDLGQNPRNLRELLDAVRARQ